MRIEVLPDPLDKENIEPWTILAEERESYVGPIMRLMQFRLKIRLPSTRSLNALDDGVRDPSPASLDQAKTALLKPIRSSTSCCTSLNVPTFCSEKESRSSVSCRNEEKRSRETLPLCSHKLPCTCSTGYSMKHTFHDEHKEIRSSDHYVSYHIENCYAGEDLGCCTHE